MAGTFASVTEEECTCSFLEESAHNPDLPIIFDEVTKEYQVEYKKPSGETGHMMIYHCPFCGGAAPESLRDKLFAVLSQEEENRLRGLTKNIVTIEDAIATLGLPDEDHYDGVGINWPEREDNAPTWQKFRTLSYSNLSETAILLIVDFHKERVQTILQGKYIGPKSES